MSYKVAVTVMTFIHIVLFLKKKEEKKRVKCDYHYTSSTSSSSRQCKRSSKERERTQWSSDVDYAGQILKLPFNERMQLIYRLPGGHILLNERENFVALVERKTVQHISQQEERSCSRADTCMERGKWDGTTSHTAKNLQLWAQWETLLLRLKTLPH